MLVKSGVPKNQKVHRYDYHVRNLIIVRALEAKVVISFLASSGYKCFFTTSGIKYFSA